MCCRVRCACVCFLRVCLFVVCVVVVDRLELFVCVRSLFRLFVFVFLCVCLFVCLCLRVCFCSLFVVVIG